MTASTTNTTSTSTSTSTDDYYGDDLPREQPCHTTELLQHLDVPIRRAIDHVLAHGWPSITRTKRVWLSIGAWRDPWDLAQMIAYNARIRGVSRWCALAAVEVTLGTYLDGQERLWSAVRGGVHLAESHAAQSLDVEVTHASIKRARHKGASWTARLWLKPITPTAASPKETSYACIALDEHEQPTAELLALLDTFSADGGPVIDLEREHVLVLQTDNRLDGRRARAITRDDPRDTTHVLRFSGY